MARPAPSYVNEPDKRARVKTRRTSRDATGTKLLPKQKGVLLTPAKRPTYERTSENRSKISVENAFKETTLIKSDQLMNKRGFHLKVPSTSRHRGIQSSVP
jgi:hypothetical protein